MSNHENITYKATSRIEQAAEDEKREGKVDEPPPSPPITITCLTPTNNKISQATNKLAPTENQKSPPIPTRRWIPQQILSYVHSINVRYVILDTLLLRHGGDILEEYEAVSSLHVDSIEGDGTAWVSCCELINEMRFVGRHKM
jgi:hypothetical protein